MISFIKTRKRIKIIFEDREKLLTLRDEFKVVNHAARHSAFADDYVYAISPAGSFKYGLTLTVIKTCKQLFPNEIYNIPPDIINVIKPFSITADNIVIDTSKFEARDYQIETIKKCLLYGRGTIVLPTAAGKSFVIYNLITNFWHHHKSDGKIFLLVPNTQLVKQMYGDFIEYGINVNDICMFSSKVPEIKSSAKIIISNRQWIEGHADSLPKSFDMVLIDECHQLGKNNNVSVMIESLCVNSVFGFTGTLPEDKENYWNVTGICGPVLVSKVAEDLQKDNYLAQLSIYSICLQHNAPQPVYNTTDDAERFKKEFVAEWNYIEQCESSNTAIMKIVKALQGNTIILFDHTEHGRNLEQLGINILTDKELFFIDGSIDLDYREEVRAKMETINNAVLLGQTKCVGTGMNIKNVSNIVFAFSAGTANVKIIQAIGRALRRTDTKTTAKLIDIYHSFKYSGRHFSKRFILYRDNYGYIKLNNNTINIK